MASSALAEGPVVMAEESTPVVMAEEIAPVVDSLAVDSLAVDSLAVDSPAVDLVANSSTINFPTDEFSANDSLAVGPGTDYSAAMHTLNSTFASTVIIPTYADLVSQTQTLAEAAAAFEADPSELTLYSLRAAWLSAASTWAEGNTFAFGPVHSLGHAAALEFPVDPLGIDTLMENAALAVSNEETDAEKSSWDDAALLPSVQGFEAIAYLLHGPEGDKALSDFSDAERRYITWLARTTRQVSGDLLAVWQLGIDGNPAYKTVLASAGESGNGAYLSAEAGTEEIVRGLINCLTVVSHEGLPEMLAAPQVLGQDAAGARSLALLHSTLQGAQTAYLGSVVVEESAITEEALTLEALRTGAIRAQSARTGGLGDWVSVANTHADTQIQQALAVSLDSVAQAMANPQDVEAVSESLSLAQSSLMATQTLLETEVLPLLQQ